MSSPSKKRSEPSTPRDDDEMFPPTSKQQSLVVVSVGPSKKLSIMKWFVHPSDTSLLMCDDHDSANFECSTNFRIGEYFRLHPQLEMNHALLSLAMNGEYKAGELDFFSFAVFASEVMVDSAITVHLSAHKKYPSSSTPAENKASNAPNKKQKKEVVTFKFSLVDWTANITHSPH